MKKNKFRLIDGSDPGKGVLAYKTRKNKTSAFSVNDIETDTDGNLKVQDVNNSSAVSVRKGIKGFEEADLQKVRNDVSDYYGKLYNSEFYNKNQNSETVKKKKELFNKYKNIPLKPAKNSTWPTSVSPKVNDDTMEVSHDYIHYNINEVREHNSNVANKPQGVITSDGTIAHEFGHVLYTPDTRKLAKKNLNLDKAFGAHDMDPGELESDINAIRYNLYRHNLWNMDRDINESDLNKLDKLNVKDYTYRRAKRLTNSKKDLLHLLNKVAYQDNKTDNTQYANNGGKIGFGDVAGLAGAIANPVAAIPAALNVIGKLAYNPASYTPAKMNESPMGYNDGGDPGNPKKIVQDVESYYGKLYDSDFYKRNQSALTRNLRKLNYNLGKVRTTDYNAEVNGINRGLSPLFARHSMSASQIKEIDKETDKYKLITNPDFQGKADLSTVTAHEFAHLYDTTSTRKIAKDRLNSKNVQDLHDASPKELEADINGVRYLLYKKGIWDMKEDINENHLKKLDKDPQGDFIYGRSKRLTKSKKDLIYLLNKVAYQDNNPQQSIAAYDGADLDQQLNIQGGTDMPMGNHAVQIEGNPGIDTNFRNIGGQDVALTQGEIVRQDPDGSAYVWSNNPKMKHPSGTTFAKAMKPIENKIARLKSRVEKDYSDVYASNALGHLEQMIEQNKNIEETMRQKKGSPTAQRFNKGGYIKANDGTKIIPDYAMDVLASAALERKLTDPIREGFENYSMVQNRTSFGVSPTITRDNSPFRNPKGFIQSNPSPLTSVTGNGLPKTDSLSTFEDKAFLGAKSLETAFRVGAALDKPIQYDTRRYNVDRIRYSPQRALDANQANYQGAQYDINTGNANTDRILRNNLYGQKMAADREVIGRNNEMQNQSDLQVNQYNAQAKANVDNINEQIRGRDYQATDAALTSIGNLSSIFQQAGGAKAHNRITMSTLNSLSRRYGIDVPELMALMQGQGDLNKGTVKYKGNGNG